MSVYRLNLKDGDVIDGRYRIVKSIGSGSYGDVFAVKDGQTYYALKVLRLYKEPSETHEKLIKYFRQEYEVAKMPGECFVHSMEYSELKGNPFFTMEYCPNGDLSKYVGSRTSLLPALARDVLIGLHDLHSSGKIHRDLKPENVLVRDNKRAALTDFGVVGNKDPKKQLSRGLFKKRQRFGSPLYMSPEMVDLKGGATYLPTIDIWSFGVMIYELLTQGSFPFGSPQDKSELPDYQSNAKREIWNRRNLHEVPYGRQWLPIVERCLKADYTERYQNVLDIIKDLEPLLDSSIPISPSPERLSRSAHVTRVVVTQGVGVGIGYSLYGLIEGKGRMVRVGRNASNDIVLEVDPDEDTYLSRHHFTIERSRDAHYWLVKDGQWMKEERQWKRSTNGTYLNAMPVNIDGQRLFTGDIITAGEFKLKIE